jgi:hypothetical protein
MKLQVSLNKFRRKKFGTCHNGCEKVGGSKRSKIRSKQKRVGKPTLEKIMCVSMRRMHMHTIT